MKRGTWRGWVVPVAVVSGLLTWQMLHWIERHLVFFPVRELVVGPDVLGRPFESVTLRTTDGVRLHGWFFPADTGSPRRSFAVLVCHGNGGNISHRVELYRVLLGRGVAVFAFDYRGYGRSEGSPSVEGTYRDAQAAYNWLRQKGFQPKRIVGYGESLGGGVVCELATREELGGLVLQSCFTSLADIGAELLPWFPVRRLARAKYDTRSKLARLSVPVLLMHSRADTLIGFHHAEANFAAANEPKLFWEIAGDHNDPLSDIDLFTTGLEKFLKLVEARLWNAGETGTASGL